MTDRYAVRTHGNQVCRDTLAWRPVLQKYVIDRRWYSSRCITSDDLGRIRENPGERQALGLDYQRSNLADLMSRVARASSEQTPYPEL